MDFRALAFVAVLSLTPQALLAQDPAPLFSGEEMRSGETISLADYRGKVVFLDFWASWCPPCLVSLPAYEELWLELQDEPFVLIAINVDEDTGDGMEFLLNTPVTYPMVADPSGDIGIPYGIRSLPVSYLIDREGNIVRRYRGFEPGDEIDIRRDIEALLRAAGQ